MMLMIYDDCEWIDTHSPAATQRVFAQHPLGRKLQSRKVEPLSPTSVPRRVAGPLRAATDRREMGALHGGGGKALSGMSVRALLG